MATDNESFENNLSNCKLTRKRKDGRSSYVNNNDIRILLLRMCVFRKSVDSSLNKQAFIPQRRPGTYKLEELSLKIANENGIEIPENSDFMVADEFGNIIMNCCKLDPLIDEYIKLCPEGSNWGFRSYIGDSCKKEIGFSLTENDGMIELKEIFDNLYYTYFPDSDDYYEEPKYREDHESRQYYNEALKNWSNME